MIDQLNIQGFGAFRNFSWRDHVRDKGNNVEKFRRLNILYGRNYSGKTTLSRVIRSLETGALPWNYEAAAFDVQISDSTITQKSLTGYSDQVRVYNRDFVQENLSFLTDHRNGEIKNFAIVGKSNNSILERIATLKARLDGGDGDVGLHAKSLAASAAYQEKGEALAAAEESRDKRLRDFARDKIKANREYGSANYNIDRLKEDIRDIEKRRQTALGENQRATLLALLRENGLPRMGAFRHLVLNYDSLRERSAALLEKKVVPTKALSDLIDDPALNSWVRSGIPLHRDLKDFCGFCRQILPDRIWSTLESHFSRESEDLIEKIGACKQHIENERVLVSDWVIPARSSFYSSLFAKYDSVSADFDRVKNTYLRDLNSLERALTKKANSIFESFAMPTLTHVRGAFESPCQALGALIVEQNEKTSSLDRDQETARVMLRLDSVAAFAEDMGLPEINKNISELKATVTAAKANSDIQRSDVAGALKSISTLEAELRDEKMGAVRVNQLLSHFFGHDGLCLDAVDDDNGVATKFQVMRQGGPAFYLSEGECSLIGFCYFMAKLSAPEVAGKPLIIYIDDPISSLDSNHVFFVFSLIEELLGRAERNADGTKSFRYKQLFISTHNLDFLKYLKNLSAPDDKHGGTRYFMVERGVNGGTSRMVLMPAYLKNYVTEFNFLFHQIYKCAFGDPSDERVAECFYSFGNNLRKFLEAYLYFKFPVGIGSEDSLSKARSFFGGDNAAAALVGRLSNELSHLEGSFDRGMKPIDIPEIQRTAKFLLTRIKASDSEQYEALLKSVGESSI